MNNNELQNKFVFERDYGNIAFNHSVLINKWNMPLASGLTLNRRYEDKIKTVYIIKGLDLEKTISSLIPFGINIVIEESFDLLNNVAMHLKNGEYEDAVLKHIIVPKKHANADWLNHLKLVNINLTFRQITRLLDHIAIWEQCIRDQHPVIIMESGCMQNTLHEHHVPRSSIISLDSGEDQFVQTNRNFISMNNPHAYSIDHFSAKRLFNDVMKNGLIEPLERHFRIDKYMIIPENKVTKNIT